MHRKAAEMSKLILTERRSQADDDTATGMVDRSLEHGVRTFVRENSTLIDPPPVVRYFTRSDGKHVTRVYPATGTGCHIDVLMCLEFSTMDLYGDTLRISLLDVSGGPSQEYVTVTVPNCVDDHDRWNGAEPLAQFLHTVLTSTYKRKTIDSRGVPFTTARVARTWCRDMDTYYYDDIPDGLVIWPRSTELTMQLVMSWCLDDPTAAVRLDYTSDGDAAGIIVDGEGREDLRLSLPAGTYPHLNRVLAWYVQGMCLESVTVPYTLTSLRAVLDLWQTTQTAGSIQSVSDSDVYDAAPVEKAGRF